MRKIIFILLILGSGLISHAETITGQVFKKGTARKELLFTYKNQIQDDGSVQKSLAQFVDPSGQVAVLETSERNGHIIKTYQVDHQQTGRKGSIVVEGDKVVFNYEDRDGKKSPETEKLPGNLVVGHTFSAYVHKHWGEIMAGKDVDIRFGVWDRQETVGFTLSKIGQEKVDGRDAILLRFKPTSFVIAALVDPVVFKFSPDGKELISMVGRVAPKQKDGGKWKDLDAEVLYKTVL